MTKQRWLTSTNPAAMLTYLIVTTDLCGTGTGLMPRFLHLGGPVISDRKLRLFACACCWGVSEELGKDAERLIEWNKAPASNPSSWAMAWAGDQVARPLHISRNTVIRKKPTQAERAALLRSIVGNPFQPYRRFGSAVCDHAMKELFAVTPTVRSIAEAAYQQRAGRACGQPGYDKGELHVLCAQCHGSGRVEDGTLDSDRLSVLADALEDAGCTEEVILRWLRGEEREVCSRCEGDGKAHGADRPFEWSSDVDYGKCVVCKGSGLGGWRPRQTASYRGDWCIDLLLGKK